MFSVKEKKKKQHTDARFSLDSKHNEIVNQFKKDKKNLSNFKKELREKEIKYEELFFIDSLDTAKIEEKNKLTKEIASLKDKIDRVENNTDVNNYYLKTSPLLFAYYNNEESKEENLNVIDFFNKKQPINSSENIDKDLKRTEILDKFLKIVDPVNINTHKNETNNICNKCHVEKKIIPAEGIMVCVNCGETKSILIDSDKPNYRDPPPEVNYFCYKRINHFNEWLSQFQAKESTQIPDEVLDLILVEIKKERIHNMADLTSKKIREYLKRLKLNKYYEHVAHIINRLNGLPPPVISQETEEKLRTMFKEIQGPFLKYCPKERKNFLSYSYVLHKFCQLLGLDELLPCFNLLKSREKLHQQDIIWKKICKDLGWGYIKSI
jgi:hypothetical protein